MGRYISSILFIIPLFLIAQEKSDNIWLLGYGSDSPDPEWQSTSLIFDDDGIKIKFFEKRMNLAENNASICDKNGNLLFYTNGCYISDKNHGFLENGNYINPGAVHNAYCEFGYPGSQGSLILPSPGNPNHYYLFHGRYHQTGQFSDYLYYTLVDLEANNGLGTALEKNKPVLHDSLFFGYLTAVKHTNNQDWWLIILRQYSNLKYKLLLTSNGIEIRDTQAIGEVLTDFGNSTGQAVFTPDGTKYITFDRGAGGQVYDFDRSTGELSNYRNIGLDGPINFGSVAVSSNSKYLYLSRVLYLYQFDLEAPDIMDSQILIDTFDGFNDPFPTNFFLMQIAPDCRIYMSTGNGSDWLHVINSPNLRGKDCDFRQHEIKIAKYNYHTIPNFPNFRLDTPYPFCDSSIVLSGGPGIFQPVEAVKVYPNPAVEEVYLEIALPPAKGGEWVLYDALGRAALREKVLPGQQAYTFSLAGLPAGLYFWTISGEGRQAESGKLIITK
jgi:hypothetical protein